MTTYSMAPPSAYQQPTYTATSPVSVSALRLAPLKLKPLPLPSTSPGLIYQPKSGLVQGPMPSGGLVSIPIPGSTVEEAPPEESLGDKIVNWWSRMPLSQKAMTAGAVVAAGYGVYWLATRKKSATPNRSRTKAQVLRGLDRKYGTWKQLPDGSWTRTKRRSRRKKSA